MGRRSASRDRRLGFKVRVIISFGVGAALVSAALALATFAIVRTELLSQRQSSALRQAFNNAQVIKQQLAAPQANVADALATLSLADGNRALVYRRGLWFSSGAGTSGAPIPASLTEAVRHGNVVHQRISDGGPLALVVGVPLPSIGIDYFQVDSLGELQSTLGVLATVLALAATATTLGGALAGWWASRRLTRPLAEMAVVASDIAGGDLGRRLRPDPDLDPLVTSFNSMVATLQERLLRDARFASDVSHELRSPITTLGGAIELLGVHEAQLPDDARIAVKTLEGEFGRFSSLVEDLLEMARVDAGANDLNLVDVPLVELVERTVAERHRCVPVSVEAESDELHVLGDKRRLQRVVANLLDNAAAHAGGATVVVVGRRGSWARVSVEDHGPGVPAAERRAIFERFYRGAASGNRENGRGTGLGLSLVAEHVHAHGGSVYVEERAGGGARFVVELPIEQG